MLLGNVANQSLSWSFTMDIMLKIWAGPWNRTLFFFPSVNLEPSIFGLLVKTCGSVFHMTANLGEIKLDDIYELEMVWLFSIYQGNEAERSQNENRGNMIRSVSLFKCGKADCFRSFLKILIPDWWWDCLIDQEIAQVLPITFWLTHPSSSLLSRSKPIMSIDFAFLESWAPSSLD